jgi:LCP family protein required for cell wall assembly
MKKPLKQKSNKPAHNGKAVTPGKGGFPVWGWIVGGIVVVLIGFGIFAYLRFNNFKDETFSGRNEESLLPTETPTIVPTATPTLATTKEVSSVAPKPTVTPVPTATPEPVDPIIRKIKQGEKISVLIMGYGGGKHEGAYLTDTLIQVIFDPAHKAVSMINIPRDTWVYIPYGGKNIGFWGKANSAYAYVMNLDNPNGLSTRYRFDSSKPNTRIDSAAILTKDVVEGITGVKVDYWATVSFDGFRQFIDSIGGVYINVEKAFDDYEYPRNDDPAIDAGVMHIHFDAGRQYMNGEKAIQYARSRKSAQDGNDFSRSKRQMNVLSSVKEQVAKPDILLKAFPIMDALQGNVRTSLTFDEVTALANYFRSSEGAALSSKLTFVPLVLSSTNFLYAGSTSDGAFILVPNEGQGNYKAIQDWIRSAMIAPELRREDLRVQVQNATGLNKPLTLATELLKQRGFTVAQSGWANIQTYTEIIDYSDGKGIETLKALRNVFPNAAIKIKEVPWKGYNGPEVVVVLGKDYSTEESFRNLPLDAGNPSQSKY